MKTKKVISENEELIEGMLLNDEFEDGVDEVSISDNDSVHKPWEIETGEGNKLDEEFLDEEYTIPEDEDDDL